MGNQKSSHTYMNYEYKILTYKPYDWKDALCKPGMDRCFSSFDMPGPDRHLEIIPFLKGWVDELPDGWVLKSNKTKLTDLINLRDKEFMNADVTFGFCMEGGGSSLFLSYDTPIKKEVNKMEIKDNDDDENLVDQIADGVFKMKVSI